MPELKEPAYITQIAHEHKSIIKMLLYFDVFSYPLHKKELAMAVADQTSLQPLLNELILSGIVEQKEEWYFLAGKKYSKRIIHPSNAEYAFKKAKRYAKLIHKFPFVRGVYISGSLSKEWADDETDVDYFIITEPERLWLCRTLLILYKKIFLLNSRKYFCLNYFIDTKNLQIQEKNIFTATEVSFLKPMVNQRLFNDFIQQNDWINNYYHSLSNHSLHVLDAKDRLLKKICEKMLRGKLGEKLDIWTMKKTVEFWRKKFPDMVSKEFEINFKSDRTISKHHPSGFQKRVLSELNSRIKEFEKSTGINLQ